MKTTRRPHSPRAALAAALAVATCLASAPVAADARPVAQLDDDVVVQITAPPAGARLQGPVVVAGYAADRRSPSGSGINERDVQIWLHTAAGPQGLLGYAGGGRDSPAVSAILGAPFGRAGFERVWDACGVAPGPYELVVWVSSLTTPGARNLARIDVEVLPCAAPLTGVAGLWSSEFGPVTFEHDPVVGSTRLPVVGSWAQPPGVGACPPAAPLPGCIGLIQNGTFDPTASVLEFGYYQDWNNTTGAARLTLAPDGRTLVGTWTQPGASGPWTMRR
jgi:hypothetical protein